MARMAKICFRQYQGKSPSRQAVHCTRGLWQVVCGHGSQEVRALLSSHAKCVGAQGRLRLLVSGARWTSCFFSEVDGVQFESVAVYLILEAKINQGNRKSLRKYEHASGPRKPPTSSQGALTSRPKNWRSL